MNFSRCKQCGGQFYVTYPGARGVDLCDSCEEKKNILLALRNDEPALPEWAKWKGSEESMPASWMAINPVTGLEMKVYRSYADYCMD